MKKLFILLLVAAPLKAQQDTIRIRHSNYETVFSKNKRYPVLVEWWVTRSKIVCANPVKRQDKFLPDPMLRKESNVDTDYRGSGFDRGHLSPAADARCDARSMEESFYFTNMAPQTPALNRGQWKNLEEWTRELAKTNDSVFVRAGCVGVVRRIGRVGVPSHCWKIIIVQKTHDTTAYIFPNDMERSQSFEMHMVPLDSVAKIRKRMH